MTAEISSLVTEILADIRSVEDNHALFDETNFCNRANAIDFLEFHVIDRIDSFGDGGALPFADLRQQAEALRSSLEFIDNELFQRLRDEVKSGVHHGDGFKALIGRYVHEDVNSLPHDEIGYDHLDLFIDRLFPEQAFPEETLQPEDEMVFYQKTPARVVLELIDKARLKQEDVFFDLGSGLGQVAILVKLMTDATVIGIEFEPAYNQYARACAADLQLSSIRFIDSDARTADYSTGTVFFLYTPFQGEIMTRVLALLEKQAAKRTIRIFTYGPCTIRVAKENWLQENGNAGVHPNRLTEFRSMPGANLFHEKY